VRFRSVVILNDTVVVKGVVTEVDPEVQLITMEISCAKPDLKEGERPFITAVFQQTLNLQ